MKKVLCFAFLFVMLVAVSAQAVVIHWAVTDNTLVGDGVTSAQLVYVSTGSAPVYDNVNGFTTGTGIGSTSVITPLGVGVQNTSYTPAANEGAYYVVLFTATHYAWSTTSLAWNDTAAITQDEFTPATGNFDPGTGFSAWTPVPEPGSAAMLALGVALIALRRKKSV